ncbi:MAG: hypothetical protein JNK64_23070 [Myxococcales bacterium]|nr:hypothetical protein [Myxococcales bacterium]
MSTYGVRTRFVALLAGSGGAVSTAAYAALVDYAAERGYTPGELRALLRPADYLEASRVLRGRGVRLADVRLDAGAWAAATALATRFAVTPIFDRLPNAAPRTTPAPPPPPPPVAVTGRALPDRATWQLTTSGASVRFAVTVDGVSHPAVVFELPSWTAEPAPADLGAARAALAAARDLAAVDAALTAGVAAARDFLTVAPRPDLGTNQRWGLEDQRRHAWFDAATTALAAAPLSAADRARVPALVARAKERLLCDRDYPMQVGSHENYWPYWRNFRGALEKALAQTAPGSDDYWQIKHRLDEVWTRKTVANVRREVDEKDVERSTGMALVHRRPFVDGPRPRVSLAKGSAPTQPRYEVLTAADGAAVYRDGAALIREADRATLPADAAVTAHAVPPDELGLRPLAPGEPARAGVAYDWNRDGAIALGAIDIGWWGHCHNESPLNALGIDPQRGVDYYRADPAVPAAARLQRYSAEDVWDAAGALAADHEDGYAVKGPYRFRPTELEVTKFVGSRNDGGHWILLELGRADARRVRIDAEVLALWHKSEPAERYPDAAARFRRDLPDGAGAFAANPDWVAAEVSDDDEITVDGLGRKLTVKTTFVTFDRQGERVEAEATATLDPARDEPVRLGDEILAVTATGGRLAEHWYNAKQRAYQQVVIEVAGATRTELSRSAPTPVRALLLRQETVYDSVIDLHDFVTKNMGLPLVFDTSSGLAVWNYPVDFLRLDRVSEVERVEAGAPFSYTRYRLRYRTMGGPAGDAHYIIKRDAAGNAVRAVAEDPMPDFAFRNERWVCAPVAPDARGAMAVNLAALNGGYLLDKGGERLVTGLWRRLGTLLYVALSAGPGAEPVRLHEAVDGTLTIVDDAAAWARLTAAP